MARTNQRLINYHTSDKTAMPSGSSVDYGEIVVRHNEEAPELLIKVGTDSFGVFQASGAVKSAIDKAVSDAKSTLNTDISNLETSLTGHVSDFNTFKGDVKNTYATKAELKSTSGSIISDYTTAISTAKAEVYDSATTFATNAVTIAEGELNSAIADVASDLESLSGVVKSISTDIGGNYVTTDTLNTTVTTLEGKISDAQKAATDASSAYTDTKFTAANTYTDTQIKASEGTTKGLITALDSKVETLSGNVHTTITNVQTALTETINNKVSKVYRYKGSCAYAELPTTGNVTGDVWNVTNANGNFPAGTNYAWTGTEWDALGGSVDLTPYAKIADVNKSIETVNQNITNLDSKVGKFSGATVAEFTSLKQYTNDTFATKTALQTAQNNITTAYTTAIGSAKDEVYTSATTFATNKVTAATSTLSQNIQTVDGRVTDLSGVTKTVKATADKAVQIATVNSGSGAKVTKNGTSLDFDFSGLIIDCGDF